MDRVVAARKLVTELVKGEQIEIRRTEIVGRDLAQWIDGLEHTPSGTELEAWLGDHAQVTELYASPTLLDELIYRHFVPAETPIAIATEDAQHPELEAQLAADPSALEPYTIYADFLQEHGDPLGELIALGIKAEAGGVEETTRLERYRKLHEARFFGGLAGQLASLSLDWRHGMVRAVEEVSDDVKPAVWAQVLKLRVCSVVESITLRHRVWKDVSVAIAEAAPPTLRSVVLDQLYHELPDALLARDLREVTLAGFAATVGPKTLPATLERLVWRLAVTKDVAGGRLKLGVRELRMQLNENSIQVARQLEAPKLERLELEIEAVASSALVGVLEHLATKSVTHLVLCAGRLDIATFAAIAKLPMAKRITKLGLTGLELTDPMIGELVKVRGNFKKLVELDLGFNELSRDGLGAAKPLAPAVISTRQHKKGSGREQRVRRFAESRLQAAEAIADPKYWKRSGVDGELRWARYEGDADYELYISRDLTQYGCTCPSSIQPCKHVVALALVDERTPLRKLPPELGLVDRVGTNTRRAWAPDFDDVMDERERDA